MSRSQRTMNRVLTLLVLVIYVPLIFLAAVAGVYSHFFGGVLVVLVILFRRKLMKVLKGSGYKGYILFVLGFDVIWETAFYLGGFELIPASFFEIILVNLLFWFLMGTLFYYLAVNFDLGPTRALLVPAGLGVLIENVPRLGMYPLEVSVALIFINAVNYAVELGFAYWFVKASYRPGKAGVLHYLLAVIALYVLFFFFYHSVSPIFL